jgi:hypothetical protein
MELALHGSRFAEAGQRVVVNSITQKTVAHYLHIGVPGARQRALERRGLGLIDSHRGPLRAQPAQLVRFRVSWTGSQTTPVRRRCLQNRNQLL